MSTKKVSDGKTALYNNAGSAILSGAVVVTGNRIGIAAVNIAATTGTGTLDMEGVFELAAVATMAFAQGDKLYWDETAEKLTKVSGGNVPAGICWEAKLSAGTTAKVKLSDGIEPVPATPIIDCDVAVAASAVTLIPARMNPGGLWIKSVSGRIVEAFGGDTEDQGVITVRDTDLNVICTLTATDAGADAVNDIVEGIFTQELATGGAGKYVAPGVGVEAIKTQSTEGASVAGQMEVFADGLDAGNAA